MTLVEVLPSGENMFRVPDTFNGLRITRALGRCCSGSHLVTRATAATAECITLHSDGNPFLVCINF
jgi:hypothetical protein